MTEIGYNIKKIRAVKKLNQSQFAELFGVKRANIGSYEELRAEPKLDLIIAISDYFKISVDDLIRKKLSVNDILHFPKHEGTTQKSKPINVVDGNNKNLYFYCDADMIKKADLIYRNQGSSLIAFGIYDNDLVFLRKKTKVDEYPFLGAIAEKDTILVGVLHLDSHRKRLTIINNEAIKEVDTTNKSLKIYKFTGFYSNSLRCTKEFLFDEGL